MNPSFFFFFTEVVITPRAPAPAARAPGLEKPENRIQNTADLVLLIRTEILQIEMRILTIIM